MEITFLGAAGTVTGSKYLVRTERGSLLVDCGLFQGLKQLRLRNREPFPVDLATIDAMVLTHAHLDHSGYLPVLVREGFGGPVFCTPATADLAAVLLRDSAHLQEEEADFANRHGYSRHHPALPLYGRLDAERAIELLRPVPMNTQTDAGAGASFRFVPAGHIPGAASVWLRADGATLAFSGDLGRAGRSHAAAAGQTDGAADWLVVESTYGDRLHPADGSAGRAGRGRPAHRVARRGGADPLLCRGARARGALPPVPAAPGRPHPRHPRLPGQPHGRRGHAHPGAASASRCACRRRRRAR